ncbi:hypothetical protein SDC9_204414 [bioreactor metagenome]|uniref:Uncharacterized protein n=1 Tax=bioreactor metagenome TaxID=1076179 RepID=A0A645J0V3_9ZZZZ
MHSHGISVGKLVELVKLINDFFVIGQQDFKGLIVLINADNIADIAVINTLSGFKAMDILPLELIIVFDLHDLVPLAEHYCTKGLFFFIVRRWIQDLLKLLIQRNNAELSLFNG